ncbi:protein of unknown function [Janthinobacterium sp. TND4EL3]|uniref:DUF4258 domain-containing protein n=1 Tax=Janthinobacterium sp. TND4EL3 TaxID=1907311 RepID=UPI0009573BB0|nr:DUF4258 domain-containing protein [Janthinobacterium sp. TND4EL3]SIQ71830.1 protein of unknown function [Janthinobacterium sp. TND4EL3]
MSTTDLPVQPYFLSTHAKLRMQQRGIDRNHIEQVLRYGRTVRAHGAAIFHVVGRKEIQRYGLIDPLLSAAEGVHLLLSAEGVVITAYRTHELRKLRLQKNH